MILNELTSNSISVEYLLKFGVYSHYIIPALSGYEKIPAGETVPSAARLCHSFSLLLQLQQVLLFTGCLQHLLQGGELTHCLRSYLPPFHCVGPSLPLHCCREHAVCASGRHAAVRRAVTVIAVVPWPRSWFTAINFWDIVPDLEQSTRLCLCFTSVTLRHQTDLGQSGHWADGGMEGAHGVVCCCYSTSTSTIILRRLVVSQRVDLARTRWSGLSLPGRGNSQATQFGTTGDTGSQEGILLGHGKSVSPGQSLGMQHELWIEGAEWPDLGCGAMRLETGTK